MLLVDDVSAVVPASSDKVLAAVFVSTQELRNLNLGLLLLLGQPSFLFPLYSVYLGLLSGHDVILLSLSHSSLLLPLFSEELGPFHLLRALLRPIRGLLAGGTLSHKLDFLF